MNWTMAACAGLLGVATACGAGDPEAQQAAKLAAPPVPADPKASPPASPAPEASPTPTVTPEVTASPSPGPEATATVVPTVTVEPPAEPPVATVAPTASPTPLPFSVTFKWPEGPQSVCTDMGGYSGFTLNSGWQKAEVRQYAALPTVAGCTMQATPPAPGVSPQDYICAFDYLPANNPVCPQVQMTCDSTTAAIRVCSKPVLP